MRGQIWEIQDETEIGNKNSEKRPGQEKGCKQRQQANKRDYWLPSDMDLDKCILNGLAYKD